MKDKIRAKDLATVLDEHTPQIKVLSLDCFDTLLWRDTASPRDIFYSLQNQPAFTSAGLTASMRAGAETRARQLKIFRQQGSEVTLNDIYKEHNPSFSQEQLLALNQEELEIEKQSCQAFQPIVDLMRTAKQRGIKVIIVSDTYLTEKQLRELLAATLPEDVFNAIHKVYCSSMHRKSKTNGLFEHVLSASGVWPFEILHIGDNLSADFIAPRSQQMKALHLIQVDECITDIFRLQTIAANMVNPAIRSTAPLTNPLRHLLAMSDFSEDKPDTLIGYASLGPLMYAFAQFIRDEVRCLQALGKKTKVLFLMRDAYLPSLACNALTDQSIGYSVHISRFSAFAASFRTEDDIARYLINIGRSDRFGDLARQLLLPDNVTESLVNIAQQSADPTTEFASLLLHPDITRIILNKSKEYRIRLMNYLKKQAKITSGDTVVFIDLGYTGTVQQKLTPILTEMGIDVAGRYLIALDTPNKNADRRGLIDSSWCDEKVMLMLVSCIAMLEQLCTSNEKSTIDYDQDGNIIYSDVTMDQHQHRSLTSIQSECVRFIHEAKNFYSSTSKIPSWSILREPVTIELIRMLYLPTKPELEYLKTFQFDLNLGTSDVFRLFNPEEGLAGLKRRGLFYMERNSKTKRTNYTAELRTAGFELAITSMVQNRFGLEIRPKDMLAREELIPAVLLENNTNHSVMLEATATHEGFFSVWTTAGQQAALLIGKKYKWIQIESVELIEMQAFINQTESEQVIDATPYIKFDHMSHRGGGLYECLSDYGVIIIKPDVNFNETQYIFRLIFRPIMLKENKWLKHTSNMNVRFDLVT
jgi:FMN phosphatase YigB (HAD superfamily)